MVVVAESVVGGPCVQPSPENGTCCEWLAGGGDEVEVGDGVGDGRGELVVGEEAGPSFVEQGLEFELVDLCQKRGGELTLYVDWLCELVVAVLSGLDRVVEAEYD